MIRGDNKGGTKGENGVNAMSIAGGRGNNGVSAECFAGGDAEAAV